ncbi:ABC transporter ATP-binding protein [Streptomyces sp. CMB-StM0423]|uniref:ABC transporter ATP-binding protein n=1 Tax=Streptomyces sp. CMB-StM0423 TaxID=2059884 RepID=UPI000C711D71|nr:ABC transporter ATP-binding protein [Streptomyces sp. CMB-StM0423]AUH39397.1 multidrug ABC transporter ATP-binding protein [Streptomyces sp. CMB-StM0423]
MAAQKPSGRDVLKGAIAGQRRGVATGSVLAVGHQLGEALVPVLIGMVIDDAVAGDDAGALVRWLLVLVAVYVVLALSFRLSVKASERAAELAAHRVRLELVGRVLDPRGGAERGRLPGAVANIATDDAKRVGYIVMVVTVGVSGLAGAAVSAVALLLISVPLGLLVLVGTPVLLWLGHLLSKPLEHRSAAEQEQAATASGVAADLIAGLRVLKGIGARDAAVERYRATSRDSLAATLRAARAEGWQNGVVLALTGGFIALVALVGGRLALSGDITLGQLVAAVGLAQFLLTPLQVFAYVNAEFAQARASAARVAEVLAAAPAVVPGDRRPAEPVRGELRLRGVELGALTEVDLSVTAGELVGVATTEPAAAEALLRCLGRIEDPAAGVVELDGIPLTGLDPAELRTAVLVAAHDADLFAGTVGENVTAAGGGQWHTAAGGGPGGGARTGAGRTGHTDGKAPAGAVRSGPEPPGRDPGPAMAAAAADEVCRALPRGSETEVGEAGRALSGGQRQRVALARALHAGRPVLVVHDPTTAVDVVTEARIAEGLRDHRAGMTTLLVTNSPALLAVADRVVFVDAGRVAAEGPHADLVRDESAYRAAVLS